MNDKKDTITNAWGHNALGIDTSKIHGTHAALAEALWFALDGEDDMMPEGITREFCAEWRSNLLAGGKGFYPMTKEERGLLGQIAEDFYNYEISQLDRTPGELALADNARFVANLLGSVYNQEKIEFPPEPSS